MLIIGKKLSPYALLSISGLLAASDQAVKWLVQQSMAYGEYVSVTPFFNWVHLWNTGAAFSLFANGVLGIFRPKTTKCSGSPAIYGL
tara:strand:+ start:2831 stop:3091 length:261 start_codon:yes stop_codon:yes gene_type:complete